MTPEFPPQTGGIGTHCFEMAKHWSHSIDVTVIAPTMSKARPMTHGFRVSEVLWSANALTRVWRTAFVIRRLMQKEAIDMVYVGHWRASGIPMRLAAVGLQPNFAYVQAIHGSEVLYLLRPGLRARIHRWLFRQVTASAALLVALGSYQMNILGRLGIDLDRAFVSPEGVDLAATDNLNPNVTSGLRERFALQGKRVILTVGRLVERKGHDTVIRALPAIIDRIPNVIYLIVGMGPNEPALQRLTREVGVGSDRVRFCGFVPEDQLAAYYAICDVFVMPNREVGPDTEGFGIVFIEAGAHRKPCIGGRSGGAGDAILDGKTGMLVDPTSPSAVMEAVVLLLNDDQLSASLGAAARQRIEEQLQYQQIARNILAKCVTASRNSSIRAVDN